MNKVNVVNIGLIVISIGVTILYYSKTHHITHYQPDESDITLSLYSRQHFDEKQFRDLSDKATYCDVMLAQYHRKVQSAWLANVGHCYQSLNTSEGEKYAQQIVQLGLRTHPKDVELNILRAQSILKTAGINDLRFRSALRDLLTLAPTHRTTLWLASAEAYYRGERSQALAYLTQLRSQVGDEPEILEFINAVKALPK